MSNLFTTIAAALVDLDSTIASVDESKQDVINEDNKLSTDYITGLELFEHKHIIRYDLTDVNKGEDAKDEVMHGEPFSVTLTPTNGNRPIKKVLVTVGGVDCTDICYTPSTGVITIDYVTGNIDIYATNVEEPVIHYINKYITGSVLLSNLATQIVSGQDYSCTVTANDGYQINNVSVFIGNQDITGTAWDGSSKTITIPAVTDNVFITIDSALKEYLVAYNLTNSNASIVISRITHGNSFACTILPAPGYQLHQCHYSMGGVETEAADGKIDIEKVTGDIVITAISVILTYGITYQLANSDVVNKVVSVNHGSDLVLHYTAAAGYDPKTPNINVIGASFTPDYDEKIISITNITLPITVIINPTLLVYHVTYLLSSCTVSNYEDNTKYYLDSLDTIITPSEGFILENISITMGDVDITESCLIVPDPPEKTRRVSIENIDGDIVINALAVINTVLVFNLLNNCATTNTSVQVDRHTSYDAILSFDSTRFRELSVQITMDGVDITSNAGVYDPVTGAVHIEDVTGNISIIAGAVSYVYYTILYNLWQASIDSTPLQVREDGVYHGIYYSFIENPYMEVKVLMGTEDITNVTGVVDLENKTIHIEEITGDLHIYITSYATLKVLSPATILAMEPGESKTILMGSPTVDNGCFLGEEFNDLVLSEDHGFTSLALMDSVAYRLKDDERFKLTLTKWQDTSTGTAAYIYNKTLFGFTGLINNTNLTLSDYHPYNPSDASSNGIPLNLLGNLSIGLDFPAGNYEPGDTYSRDGWWIWNGFTWENYPADASINGWYLHRRWATTPELQDLTANNDWDTYYSYMGVAVNLRSTYDDLSTNYSWMDISDKQYPIKYDLYHRETRLSGFNSSRTNTITIKYPSTAGNESTTLAKSLKIYVRVVKASNQDTCYILNLSGGSGSITTRIGANELKSPDQLGAVSEETHRLIPITEEFDEIVMTSSILTFLIQVNTDLIGGSSNKYVSLTVAVPSNNFEVEEVPETSYVGNAYYTISGTNVSNYFGYLTPVYASNDLEFSFAVGKAGGTRYLLEQLLPVRGWPNQLVEEGTACREGLRVESDTDPIKCLALVRGYRLLNLTSASNALYLALYRFYEV